MDKSPKPTPVVQTTASTTILQPTARPGAAHLDVPEITSAFPLTGDAEDIRISGADLQRFKQTEAARRARLLGEHASLETSPSSNGTGTPWRPTARDLQELKARARTIQVPFRTLRAWNAAFHLQGLNGLEPGDWKAAPRAEALVTARQRLERLGALAEAESITPEDINAQAATLGWRPQRLQRWLQRYRTGGLLALLGLGTRHAASVSQARRQGNQEMVAAIAAPGTAPKPHYGYNRDRYANQPGEAQRRPRDLGALDEQELEEALQRRALLGGLAEQPHASREAVVACALANGVGARTIWSYLRQYRAYGLAGLAPHERSDRDRFHGLDGSVVELVRAIALTRPSWKDRAIAEVVCARANERGLAGPSIDQVRAISRRIPEALRQIAAGDYAAFNNTSLLTYPMPHLATEVVLQIDHRYPLPMEVRDDRPARLRNASGVVRPYLTQAIDASSRGVPAGRFSFAAPTRFTVVSTIRDALLPSARNVYGGRPDEIWVDNGRELIAHLVYELCQELGIRLWPGPAHAPRVRGIVERLHQTLDTRLWSTLPGYTGSDAGAGARGRPSPHTRWTRPPLDQLYTLRELEERYWAFIAEYNAEPHSELDKQSPLEFWRQRCFAPPVDPRMLDPLLQEGVTRKISKEGIKLRGRVYYHSDLFDPTLVDRDLDSVVARVTAGDVAPDEVEVYANGRWLCTARAVAALHDEGPITREEVAEAQRRQRRGLRAQVKRAQRVVDAAVGDRRKRDGDEDGGDDTVGKASASSAATSRAQRHASGLSRLGRGARGGQRTRGASAPTCIPSLPTLPAVAVSARRPTAAAMGQAALPLEGLDYRTASSELSRSLPRVDATPSRGLGHPSFPSRQPAAVVPDVPSLPLLPALPMSPAPPRAAAQANRTSRAMLSPQGILPPIASPSTTQSPLATRVHDGLSPRGALSNKQRKMKRSASTEPTGAAEPR